MKIHSPWNLRIHVLHSGPIQPINSLGLSDAYIHQLNRPSLAQIMACRYTQNQYWLILIGSLGINFIEIDMQWFSVREINIKYGALNLGSNVLKCGHTQVWFYISSCAFGLIAASAWCINLCLRTHAQSMICTRLNKTRTVLIYCPLWTACFGLNAVTHVGISPGEMIFFYVQVHKRNCYLRSKPKENL